MTELIGMNFKKWCAMDEDDTRKIHYKTPYGDFTSDDNVDIITMNKIQDSVIKSIDLVNDEWHIELEEEQYKPEKYVSGVYIRIDYEDETAPVCETYETKKEVMEDAERFYFEQFDMEEDFNPDFKVKTFKQAVEFWDCNGYSIYKSV